MTNNPRPRRPSGRPPYALLLAWAVFALAIAGAVGWALVVEKSGSPPAIPRLVVPLDPATMPTPPDKRADLPPSAAPTAADIEPTTTPSPGAAPPAPADPPAPLALPADAAATAAEPEAMAGESRKAAIALIIGGLGRAGPEIDAAIERLPAAVTFAFDPRWTGARRTLSRARDAGHQVLLQIPMEPANYPANDPGPYTLLTGATDEENLRRLDWLLAQAEDYDGVMNYMGSRFTRSAEKLRPVIEALRRNDLIFVDSRTTHRSIAADIAREAGLASLANDRHIDAVSDAAAIDGRLGELERIAAETGLAVGIGFAYSSTVERVAAWSATLGEKGLRLVSVSEALSLDRARRP